VVQGQDAPVVVAAGRLEGNEETGWAEYSGAPRLIQGQNQVSGERIRLNRESREFVVEGAVDSLLIDQEGDEPRSYRVFAGRMERPGTGQPVVYEEAVQLVTEGLQLQAPRLLLMPGEAQPDAFERVVAEGGVEIDENGRKWRGRKATYLIASRRLVVGN
jgi:lipopolysaccharide assembly outer membrane protein LptD (OstA)